MSEIKVNKISPRTACGTTTLGDSGDSFVIPAGATITNNGTQTGFGRTGTVDWQTGSIKTSTFTATNGEGYFVNTSGGAVTVNLPAGAAGSIVAFNDYKDSFATHNVTISANGSDKISGTALDGKLTVNGQAVTLVFVDSTEGWKTVNDSQNQVVGLNYMAATGGSTADCGNFRIHTFTGPGTFCVSAVSDTSSFNKVDYVIVGGGGGGGSGNPASGEGGGGGGAGGFRGSGGTDTGSYCAGPGPVSGCVSARTVSVQGYPIAVGGGGAGVPATGCAAASSGVNSSFDSVVGAGGGGGSTRNMNPPDSPSDAKTGGSGGGGAYKAGAGSNQPGAAGNTPPVSPSQGNPGGQHACASGGGGGGIGGAGGRGTACTSGGAAGVGIQSSITGSAVGYAGGGGGGTGGPTIAPAPPVGGGGAGANPSTSPTAGTANTGGGGGGGDGPNASSAGGSGIVILRYRFQ
jgi:hypothetical protein